MGIPDKPKHYVIHYKNLPSRIMIWQPLCFYIFMDRIKATPFWYGVTIVIWSIFEFAVIYSIFTQTNKDVFTGETD